MFTRARLHLTLLYAGLLGITVVLIAGAIGVFAVQEARRTDDRELQIRAAAVAGGVPDGPPPPYSRPMLPERGRGDHGPHLEQQGVLESVLAVRDGQNEPQPSSTLPGLPNTPAARQALQAVHGTCLTSTA